MRQWSWTWYAQQVVKPSVITPWRKINTCGIPAEEGRPSWCCVGHIQGPQPESTHYDPNEARQSGEWLQGMFVCHTTGRNFFGRTEIKPTFLSSLPCISKIYKLMRRWSQHTMNMFSAQTHTIQVPLPPAIMKRVIHECLCMLLMRSIKDARKLCIALLIREKNSFGHMENLWQPYWSLPLSDSGSRQHHKRSAINHRAFYCAPV